MLFNEPINISPVDNHGHDQHDHRVEVGYARCQSDQDVHVGCALPQRQPGILVEVAAAEYLDGSAKNEHEQILEVEARQKHELPVHGAVCRV